MHTIGNGVDIARSTRRRPAEAHPPPEPDPVRRHGSRPTRECICWLQAFDTLVRERADLELTLVGKAGMMPFDVLGVLLKDDPALGSLRPFYGQSPMGWLKKEVLGQRNSYLAHLRACSRPRAHRGHIFVARCHWRS